jgi:hypothetical protein
VDARAPGLAHSLSCPVDVGAAGARKSRDAGVLDAARDLAHRLEVAIRGDREPGLNDVHAHVVEEVGDLELLLERHGGAGALLAVAQGGVEDEDAVLVGRGAYGHGFKILLGRRRSVGRSGFELGSRSPECPGALARPALRGG